MTELVALAIASVAFPLAGFIVGLLGHIGSFRHAIHVAAAIIVIELIITGVVALAVAFDCGDD